MGWFKKVEKITAEKMELKGGSIFLRRGVEEIRRPRWKVWACLVDGGLATLAKEQDVQKFMGMRWKTMNDIGTDLTVREVKLIAKMLQGAGERMEVRSVVTSAVKQKEPHLESMVKS